MLEYTNCFFLDTDNTCNKELYKSISIEIYTPRVYIALLFDIVYSRYWESIQNLSQKNFFFYLKKINE